MRALDVVALSFRPFRARPVESLLIVVALALGVGVLTAMLALIAQGQRQQEKSAGMLYNREIRLVPRKDDWQAFYQNGEARPLVRVGRVDDKPVVLSRDDLAQAKRAAPAVQYAYLSDYSAIQEPPVPSRPNMNREIEVRAVTSEYLAAADLKLQDGSWPTKDDYERHNRVVVLTEWYARQRFGEKRAVGQEIAAQSGEPYKVIGVFAAPDSFEFASDHAAQFGARGLVPWGIRDFMVVDLRELKFVAWPGQTDAALAQLRAFADNKYGSGLSVGSQREQQAQQRKQALSSALVTALFAAGGLLIASVNIMNLMLARVLAGRRRVGVARALGASTRAVFGFYLAEALTLGVVGGSLGLALARAFVSALQTAFRGGSGPPLFADLALQPPQLLLGFLVALLASLLFGAYPALVAARTRPAEALRA